MHALPCAKASPGPTSCSEGNQWVAFPGEGQAPRLVGAGGSRLDRNIEAAAVHPSAKCGVHTEPTGRPRKGGKRRLRPGGNAQGACTKTGPEPPRGKPMRRRSAMTRRPPAKGSPPRADALGGVGTGGLLSHGTGRSARCERPAQGGRTGSQRSRGEPKGTPGTQQCSPAGPGRFCGVARTPARPPAGAGGARIVDAPMKQVVTPLNSLRAASSDAADCHATLLHSSAADA